MKTEIREYTNSDISSVVELWHSSFGDDKNLITELLQIILKNGKGFICIAEENIISMAFILTGLKYKGKELGYIYAVATDRKFRKMGYGEKVVKACVEYAHSINIYSITTSPATLKLFDWYKKIIDTELKLECNRYEKAYTDNKGMLSMCKISPKIYEEERALLLNNTDHIEFPSYYFEMEDKICKAYNGALYSFSNGIACGYVDGKTLYVKEILCNEKDTEKAIDAMLKIHNAEKAIVTIKGTGNPYIAYNNLLLSRNSYWGPVLD